MANFEIQSLYSKEDLKKLFENYKEIHKCSSNNDVSKMIKLTLSKNFKVVLRFSPDKLSEMSTDPHSSALYSR